MMSVAAGYIQVPLQKFTDENNEFDKIRAEVVSLTTALGNHDEGGAIGVRTWIIGTDTIDES